MREIKFRAWEKELKEMIQVYDIQFFNPNEINVDGIILQPRKEQPIIINTKSVWRLLDEVELMQFTGLYDKNGKEIYEGDIIIFDYEKEIAKPCKVFFHDCQWKCVSADEKWGDNLNEFIPEEELEIIGNIYENPELLEKK